MKTISKRPARKTTVRSLRQKIASFADEFMMKPGERGFDGVGELVKSRRNA
ncbi:MAG: hypothetical protein ACK5TH_14065 [Prosthecobacter sp.]|jgi:hypothetical protein